MWKLKNYFSSCKLQQKKNFNKSLVHFQEVDSEMGVKVERSYSWLRGYMGMEVRQKENENKRVLVQK